MDRDEGSTKTDDSTDAGIDQAESYANDPANSSTNHVDALKDKKSSGNGPSSSRMDNLTQGRRSAVAGAKSFAGSKNAKIGGAGAGLAALIFASFLALLPLKLEAFMKNIFQERVGDKVEYMMERRATKMVIQGLAQSGAEVGVYSNGTLLTSMYRNWKLKKFESKFSAKSGIKLEAIQGKTGGIRLVAPDGVKTDFKNAADFEKYLAKGELKGVDARKFIKEVTRAETHWIQIYKRASLRKYMRNAYGITKWSWFTGKSGEEGKKDFRAARIDTSAKPYNEQAPKIIDCALDNNSCPKDDGERKAPHGENPAGIPESDPSKELFKEGLTEATAEATDETKNGTKGVANKALTNALTKIVGEKIAGKLVNKAIPIIGQILLFDMIARIDHFFHVGDADKALRAMHKVQYATQFASFSSMADNFKDPNKKMSGDEVNEVMTQLGDPSKSAGFHEIFLNSDGGEGIKSGLGVSDRDNVYPIKDDYNKVTNLLPLNNSLRAWHKTMVVTGGSKVIDGLNFLLGKAAEIVIRAALILPMLEIKAIDALFGFNLEEKLKLGAKEFGELMKDSMLALLTPAADGTETDGDLFTAIDAGGAVTGQDYTKSLGGHKMNAVQTSMERRAIAFENQLSRPGIIDRLFSPDYNRSMVNQMAVLAPATPGQAASQFSSYSLALMKNPFSIFNSFLNALTNRANADTPRNIYGLQNYGYTEEELDQPLQVPDDNNKDGKIDKEDCEYNADGSKKDQKDFNDTSKGQICLLDIEVALSLNSFFTTDDDGGLGNGGAQNGTNNGAPAGTTIDTATIFQDSSQVSCAIGTKYLGVVDGYREGAPVKITLCAIPGLSSTSSESTPGQRYYVEGANGNTIVNSRISGATLALVNAARADGIPITAFSSYRTMAHQQDLCESNAKCRSGKYSDVAKPGTSNHQMALAIDFATAKCPSRDSAGFCTDPSNTIWQWLSKNASKFGYKPYTEEAWHWSVTGG